MSLKCIPSPNHKIRPYVETGSVQMKSVNMSSYCIRMVPTARDWCLYEGRSEGRETNRRKSHVRSETKPEWCRNKSRNATRHQQPPEAQRAGKSFSRSAHRVHDATDISISDVPVPELWHTKFLLSLSPQSLIIFYNNLGSKQQLYSSGVSLGSSS